MATLNDVEVWDDADENLLSTFEGLSSVCDGISFSITEASPCKIYWYNGSEWLRWSGPRPANPPGR